MPVPACPEASRCDNSPPWGCAEPVCPYTTFTVWLLRLGLRVQHGRPDHPQTQGKEERFHRTLQAGLLDRHTWADLAPCAREFPDFRCRYNCTRPHDALDGATPVSRDPASPRSLPATLPSIDDPALDTVKQVRTEGRVIFGAQPWSVGRAFAGLSVGLRPSAQADGQWAVFFREQRLGQLDLRSPHLAKHHLRSISSSPSVT